MKRIAIITGATGGIGSRFAEAVNLMDDIDEIWSIGRNTEKLKKLKESCDKTVSIETDLANDGIDVISGKLSDETPDIRMLINNAGVAYMGEFEKMGTKKVEQFCFLNCSVPSQLISACLPYMHDGARIINISSASSFQPNPYLSMYSASKVYLKNLSRALSVELKERKITVTCVCPGWVDTEMLKKDVEGKEVKYPGMISADLVVKKALKDSLKGKDMSVPGFFANYFRFYSKIMPDRLIMKQWVRGIRKYI